MSAKLTVGHVIERILPQGTRLGLGKPSWYRPPVWPPDIFAAVASLAYASSCYSEPGLALSRNANESNRKAERAKAAKDVGAKWARSSTPPTKVAALWRDLISAWNSPVSAKVGQGWKWKRAVLDLLAISDEACEGVGYAPEENDGIANVVWDELTRPAGKKSLLRLPESIAYAVPREVACVLPKASTPNVGCTLRSLSHHLALCPSSAVVSAEWYVGTELLSKQLKAIATNSHSLNLLLIPFPYVVESTDFQVTRPPQDEKSDGYFCVVQGWLKHRGRKISAAQLSGLVADLVRTAEKDVGEIHGIVFPEASLEPTIAVSLARVLAKRSNSLDFIVAGCTSNFGTGHRNEAAVFRLNDGDVIGAFTQSKHHRWKLTARQIRQYNLGNVLDPEHMWWEDIDVHSRKLQFDVNRHEAVIAALICEDLARYDPVLPVLTAVGPTIVIALLMDGPQLEARWCGRYATVLAEDPGSSVLTLTNVGMIDRSKDPGGTSRRVIGLWKDRATLATELVLPDGHHGIVLSLASSTVEQTTLDRRNNGKSVVEYRLGGVRSVKLDDPPRWLERRL